jgi:RNA polymerase sigma-70 factor (sigma-E family)
MDKSERDAEFAAFVIARSARLGHFATMLCGDPARAEDLVQGALERVYLRWAHITGDPFAYARTAILNQHLSWLRRRAWRERLVDSSDDFAMPSGPDHAPKVDQQLALLQALRTLTRRQRAIVVLRFVEDLSENETAATLGVAVGTVKATTFRALAKLRTALAVADLEIEESA